MNTDRTSWKFKGGNGRFTVWHAGKNIYFVTDGRDGPVLSQKDQFGLAFAEASRQHAVDQYYTDRVNSGQAALTAHR